MTHVKFGYNEGEKRTGIHKIKSILISMMLFWNPANTTTMSSTGNQVNHVPIQELNSEYTIMVGWLQKQEYVDDVMPTHCIDAVL